MKKDVLSCFFLRLVFIEKNLSEKCSGVGYRGAANLGFNRMNGINKEPAAWLAILRTNAVQEVRWIGMCVASYLASYFLKHDHQLL